MVNGYKMIVHREFFFHVCILYSPHPANFPSGGGLMAQWYSSLLPRLPVLAVPWCWTKRQIAKSRRCLDNLLGNCNTYDYPIVAFNRVYMYYTAGQSRMYEEEEMADRRERLIRNWEEKECKSNAADAADATALHIPSSIQMPQSLHHSTLYPNVKQFVSFEIEKVELFMKGASRWVPSYAVVTRPAYNGSTYSQPHPHMVQMAGC